MRKIFLFLILLMLRISVADAQTTPDETQIKLLNFSPDLLQAAENCSAYREDFTAQNPELIHKSEQVGTEQQIWVEILGWQEEKCQFKLEYIYKKENKVLPQGLRENCELIKENLDEMVDSMKDRTDDLYEDTIVSQNSSGMEITREMTGSRFDVTFAKVKAMLCEHETFAPEIEEPEQEEQLTPEEFAERYNLFSPEFMLSLQNCSTSTEVRKVDNYKHIVRVKGKENDRCKITYDQFELKLPMEIISNIHGFDDVRMLLKNKDFTRLDYQPEYDYDGLVHAYNACRNKHAYYGVPAMKRINELIISRSMNAQYDGKACIINLINEVEFNGEKQDYSVMCRLTNKTIDELWPVFEEVLKKYGEKQRIADNGRKQFSKGENNKETKEADIALMYYMQQQEYCRRPQLDK